MKLKVINPKFTDNSTISELYVDDVFECFVLEPKYRGDDNSTHEYHVTASPSGLYKVIIDMSARFTRLMPHVIALVDFDFGTVKYNSAGVRIHWGNYPKDTEACLLTGTIESIDFVGHSVDEFNVLYGKLEKEFNQGEEISLEIIRTFAL